MLIVRQYQATPWYSPSVSCIVPGTRVGLASGRGALYHCCSWPSFDGSADSSHWSRLSSEIICPAIVAAASRWPARTVAQSRNERALHVHLSWQSPRKCRQSEETESE